MNTAELQHEWLFHQRAMAQVLPQLIENARVAAAHEIYTIETWRERLGGALSAVGAALQGHVAADEHPEGFLPSSARRAPRLIHAIEHLRAEHRTLIREVAEAKTMVRRIVGADDCPATIRAVDAVLDHIERHLDASYRLAMEIANDDLGAGD